VNEPIITSLLDTDFYKLTMAQVALLKFPDVHVRYKFTCRTQGINFRPCLEVIREHVDHLCTLRLTNDERDYLAGLPGVMPPLLRFMDGLKLNRGDVWIECDKDGNLDLIVEGPWTHTIWFEVPLLAIVSEVYQAMHTDPGVADNTGRNRISEKVRFLRKHPAIRHVEFGTRRRYAKWMQKMYLTEMRGEPGLLGTSNVRFAMDMRLDVYGTMAHELFMVMQALTRIDYSQELALRAWNEIYGGALAVALTDTLGSGLFFDQLPADLGRVCTGFRQDSGDWRVWTHMAAQYCERHGMNPKDKLALYSDGLTFEKALEIWQYASTLFKVSFGIGTHCTNDAGYPALNIVIKATHARREHEKTWFPLVKISDTPGKTMCEDEAFKAFALQQCGRKS